MEFANQSPLCPKLHKICWLGNVFLSEGERKTPVLELLEHTDLLFIDGGKSPLKREEEREEEREEVRKGLPPNPLKPTNSLPRFFWGKKLGPWSKQAKYFRFVAVPKHTGTYCTPRASLTAIPAPLHSRNQIPGAGPDDPSKAGYSMKLNSN